PSTLDNPRDREKLMFMLRTFFESHKGWHIQYNIVSRETLLEAKQYPDKY
ncbi:glycine radical domain-containing protein, partial [Enterobacter hormaechei]